jgi:1-acyl-sn-glycerol-3-phosphate acyltransferase
MLIPNILFYMGIVPATLLFAIIGVSFFFVPYRVRYYCITRWSHFFIFWAKISCGLRYTVEGLENLRHHHEPAIVLSNHQSMWETVFMQVLLPTQTWILKKSLLNIPFFGLGLRLLEPIAIDREDKQNAIKQLNTQVAERLSQGRWVVLFPEGTRVAPHVHHRFSKSGANLSKTTGYSIIPIVHNAGLFWPRGFWIRKSGTIRVVIGPAITPDNKEIADIHEAAESWIRARLKDIGG